MEKSAVDQLYEAVRVFVDASGGKVLVVGGVEVISWPGDPVFRFTLGIRCTGTPPAAQKEATPLENDLENSLDRLLAGRGKRR